MSGIAINDAGTWRTLTHVYVNDAGTWRDIQEIYVNDAGTWRSVFTKAVVSISDQSLVTTSDPGAIIGYALGLTASPTDGVAYELYNTDAFALENWVTPTTEAGAAFECRATLNSGAASGSATGSWLALSSARSWFVQNDSFVASSADLTIEIRDATTGVVLDSAHIVLRSSPGA